MALQQTSPVIKFENSPAESFLSIPGDLYPPLFTATTPTATMNPMEVMTPKSFTEEKNTNTSAHPPVVLGTPPDSPTPAPVPEKKPSKKRKSWGQVLPEPKTNLPPRKRAKTEDEKEQRRVERVLRNRRAAQSSRERKRQEVENLEKRNKELESMLLDVQKTNRMLVEELQRFRSASGIVTRSSSALDSLLDSPVTLSQELFSSKDGHNPNADSTNSLIDDILVSNPTVNPASLSPELGPVADSCGTPSKDAEAAEQTSTTSPDLTQCPAVSHVGRGGSVTPSLANFDHANLDLAAASDDADFSLNTSVDMSPSYDTDRLLFDSGLLPAPHSPTLDDDNLAGHVDLYNTHQSDFNLFDFIVDGADFVAANDVAAADHEFSLPVHDLETRVS